MSPVQDIIPYYYCVPKLFLYVSHQTVIYIKYCIAYIEARAF